MLKYKLWSPDMPEEVEIIFEAENLEQAKNVVIKRFPQYFYGCNINCLDNSDFFLAAVKRFYQDRQERYGIPMPV